MVSIPSAYISLLRLLKDFSLILDKDHCKCCLVLLSFGIKIQSTYRCNALNYDSCIIKLSTSSKRLSNYRSSNSDALPKIILQNERLIDLDSLLWIDYSEILSTIPCPQSARFASRRRKCREQLNGKASGSQTESERIIRRGTEKTGGSAPVEFHF